MHVFSRRLSPNVYRYKGIAMNNEERKVRDQHALLDKEILNPADGCTCFRVRRLARRVTKIYEESLASTGLSVTQYTILSMLRHVGPMSMSELSHRLGMDRTTLTRTLRPLEAMGHLTNTPEADRRQRRIAMTESGRVALRTASPAWKRAQAGVFAILGDAGTVALNDTLDQAYARLPDSLPAPLAAE
ncbi:MAG: MarR family winged helix-turn-helix transcriptional regulator [Reyranellaceae bacterium]